MRRLVTIVTAFVGLTPALAAAQEPQCAMPLPDATAACNTAVDAVRAFYPLAGMIISGGNPVLGTAGSLGGLGHLTLTARVNAIKAASVRCPSPPSEPADWGTSRSPRG